MPNIFRGKHIRLRAIEPGDWETHFEWDKDTDGARMLFEIPFPFSTTASRAWAETQSKAEPDNDVFN